jgi:hypothetical protein
LGRPPLTSFTIQRIGSKPSTRPTSRTRNGELPNKHLKLTGGEGCAPWLGGARSFLRRRPQLKRVLCARERG